MLRRGYSELCMKQYNSVRIRKKSRYYMNQGFNISIDM